MMKGVTLLCSLLSLLPLASAGLFKRNAQVTVDNNLHLPDYEAQFDVIQTLDEYSHRSLQSQATWLLNKPYFTVRTMERDFGITSPGEIHVKIHNHKPNKWYSVTILSANEYTGSANFLRKIADRPGNPLLYSWIPKFNGNYEIIVHELSTNGESIATPPIGEEFKFSVVDKPGVDSRRLLLETIGNMPPCQTVQRGDLYSVWDGTWLGPKLHGGVSGMRNGWYFLPSNDMNCKIEYFTDDDLRRNSEDRSIYILGSSKERGVFLSLVDMLLDSKEKEHMSESVISKCWGRAFVTKSKLKVFYQDWRSTYFQHAGTPGDYLCHNEKVIREGGMTYTTNGQKVWQEIFDDPTSWPSVILMGVSNDEGFNNGYDLQHFINTLPSTWHGTLLLTDGAFSAMRAGNGDQAEYIKYRRFIKDLVAGLNDDRVRWIDGKGVSKDQRMHGERGPDYVTGSQHFHGTCDANYIDESGRQMDMKICSNVTEMLGQLMIGYALGPKEEYIQRVDKSVSRQENNEAVYCHACPEDLLPFHITHHPEMTCTVGALHPRSTNEIHHAFHNTCPDICLKKIPPIASRQTQSGVVHERRCPEKYFLDQAPAPPEPSISSDDDVADQFQKMKEADHLTYLNLPTVVDKIDQFHKAKEEAHKLYLMNSPKTAERSPVNAQVRRRADILLDSSGINAFVPDEDEYMSLFTFCIVTMALLFGLTAIYKSKIKDMVREKGDTIFRCLGTEMLRGAERGNIQ